MISRVFIICHAYESGIGHGLQRDRVCNPYSKGSEEHEAWSIGYKEGDERAEERDEERKTRKQAPEVHPSTRDLVARFSAALLYKLSAAEKKYGYTDGWMRSDWMDECRQHLREHVQKGDPRDVAAYCAFLWHHGESTAVEPIEGEREAVAWIDSISKQHEEALRIARQLFVAGEPVTAQNIIDLNRCCECFDDGEGYDVPKNRMRELRDVGLVDGGRFGRYHVTDRGMSIRSHWFVCTQCGYCPGFCVCNIGQAKARP